MTRLRRRSRERLKQLAEDLGSYEFKGSLGSLLKDLGPEHFLILATLLRRHLRSVSPYMEGRALLATVFDTSFELLKGLELLQPTSYLRRNGLLLQEPGEENTTDLLECRFRLSEAVVEAFLEECGIRSRQGGRRRRGYATQREYLVDLKLLHNLCQARAKRLFSAENWWRLGRSSTERADKAVELRITRFARTIKERLGRTEKADEFPIRRFVLDFGLTPTELMVVLHLFFLELLEGNPYADAVHLVQLVSSSEEELLENRLLFQPQGTLRRHDIVEIETMLEGRELTSECHLSNWVVERILGETTAQKPIDAEEKLNFHLYLKRLGSSNFLKDL